MIVVPDIVTPSPAGVTGAAWLPDERPNHQRWSSHEQAAVRWVIERADAEGVAPLVFYPDEPAVRRRGDDAIAAMTREHGHATGCDPTRPGSAPRAVLAVRPDARSLCAAASAARGASLCVIEMGAVTSLIGWAAALGAHDVSGLYSSPPAINAEAAYAIDLSVTAHGRHDWEGAAAADSLHEGLGDVVAAGLIDVETLVSYALAYAEVSEVGARVLVEQLSRYDYATGARALAER